MNIYIFLERNYYHNDQMALYEVYFSIKLYSLYHYSFWLGITGKKKKKKSYAQSQ